MDNTKLNNRVQNKPLRVEKQYKVTKVIENTTNANTGYVMFGFLGPKARELKENIALDLISIILGEGTSSRLYQNMIEKQDEPLVNYVDSTHYQFKDGNNFFIQANFRPENKDVVIEAIKAELSKLIIEKITDKELLKAKKKTKCHFAENAETVSEIGETIGYYMTVCDDLRLVEDYLKLLEDITVEDLEASVKKYLDVKNAVISVLMPE